MMEQTTLQTLIKQGIKAELDSITLYNVALENATDPDVIAFLDGRVNEEKTHYNYLIDYLQKIDKAAKIEDVIVEIPTCCETVSPVISPEFIQRVATNQVLFSAFSMAALLEKKAIDHYRAMAEATDHPGFKAFFQMMMKWESSHYDDVLSIQKEAEERYWQVNSFQPF